MSIIGLGMAALPCCAEEDVEAGSAALRVDWPVYPRRADHNTVTKGGNRRWAETAAQERGQRLEHGGQQGAAAARGVLEERAPPSPRRVRGEAWCAGCEGEGGG
jgi:hypothetical protein